MTFAELGLGPEILKAVEESGYVNPTPIQEQAIPIVLMGRDVLGVAQTGTGKTAGFTLPMIEILAGSRGKARMPRSLILAPTRELASQVADNFEKYGKYHKLSMALLIGGESFGDQEKVLNRGVDVLIATPGRLMDMFSRGNILLNDVKILVIDEADRMLDMGFIPDVEKIVSFLPKMRQTLFFSATMAPEIRRLADAFLMNPKEISVDNQTSAATTVTQHLVVCEEQDKREALRHLIRIEDVKNAFIFCNRKRDVDVLYRSLQKHEFDVVQLHGDMAQSARTETLEKFRAGDVRLMVCSDVAARGIDISNVSHVFNFDPPHHAEDYIHRIGRTGRAGKEGRAFTIATPDDGRIIGAIFKLIGNEIPKVSIEGLPDLELDLNAAPRRGRGPKRETKSTEGRPERKPREPRGERAPRVERQPSEEQPALEERPAREERAPRAERQPRAERAPREERPREDRQPREERQPREDRQPREERPVRDEQRPVRDDRNFRRERGGRGRRDEFGIGEMTHGDHVIGFGAHMPDFMMVEVTFPPPLEKKPRGKSPTEDEIEGDDDDLEIEAVANTPEEVFAEIEAESAPGSAAEIASELSETVSEEPSSEA